MKQNAIIVDIDGTVTNDPLMIPEELKYTREGKDKFYKSVKYYLPETMDINHNIKNLVDTLANDFKIIFVTGREAEPTAYENTELFLKNIFPTVDWILFMRAYNDFRPNQEVKQELLNYIKKDYNVVLCLDDEDGNINMFKENGIQVLKVIR